MKIRKWAWLMWAQYKKEKKTKGKGEWAELIGLGMKIIILPINNNLKQLNISNKSLQVINNNNNTNNDNKSS